MGGRIFNWGVQNGLTSKARSIGLMALAAIFVQCVFWFLVNPILFAPPQRPEVISVGQSWVATVKSADASGFETASFKPVDLPSSECCAPGYRLLRTDFELKHIPKSGLALIPSIGADNLHIRLNGQWLRQEGRIELPNITYHGNLKTILYLSPGALKPGVNRLEYVIARSSIPYFDFGKPMLAPYAEATELLAQRNFILNDYKVISYSFGLLAAALAFLLIWRSEQKRFAVWVFILLVAWSLRYHYYTWVDPPFSGNWRSVYYFVLTLTIPVAWVNLVDAWSGKPMRWLTWLTCLIWGGIAASFYSLLTGSGAGPYDQAVTLTNGTGLILGAVGILRLFWHFFRRVRIAIGRPRYFCCASR